MASAPRKLEPDALQPHAGRVGRGAGAQTGRWPCGAALAGVGAQGCFHHAQEAPADS